MKTGFTSAGYWNGQGIISSAAHADSTFLTTLGMIQAISSGLFDGQGYSAGDILVKYTYFGDANLDGKVDGTDYSVIDAHNGSTLANWSQGDFNYDGSVNGSDYSLIDNAFNMQGSHGVAGPLNLVATATSEIAGTVSSVPEPNIFVLLITSIGLLQPRRGRRRPSKA